VTKAICIEDLRRLARRRVPQMFYDYVDSGSWSESTYRANEADLARILLRQRVACDISNRSTASTMLGERVAIPVALAPTGLAGMQHADGEIVAAQAAEKFGVPFTLSTVSVCSIEEVAACTTRPFWFQLYMMRDRDFVIRLIERARAASCSALVLTLDLPLGAQRHKDVRNGLSTPPRLTLRNMLNLATKPRWCLGMLGARRHNFGNLIGHIGGVADLRSLTSWVASQFDSSITWRDVEWVKRLWGGKLIVKGILDPEDARAAVAIGADAIVVSNHGGRQLDGAPSSIAVLPRIVAAVGTDVEVWFDGGIRGGQDVIKAIALGAQGTLIGRAFLYGLGAMGGAGVTRCLQIIARELDMTMGLCGKTDIKSINRDILYVQQDLN